MKYLVDANVLSEATKPRPDTRVVQWLRDHEAELAVSAIVLGELEYGILLLPSGKRRKRLEEWFQQGVNRLRTLDFDVATASAWARMLAKLKQKGLAMSVKDSQIAASASHHGLIVVTRNVDHFRHAGVKLENPFAP